jgi:TatD DNase family protein
LFVNIHTHTTPLTGERAIQNKYANFESIDELHHYSIALHPWYIGADWPRQLSKIKEYAIQKNIIAIGETGLDKACKTDWPLQQQVFKAHIQLANQLQKPLLIHCVRAWDEVLGILKNEKAAVPVIFHGYNKNVLLAKRIMDTGYYLSFGKALQQTKMQEVLKQIPLSKCFFETDDADVTIATIYNLAAQALSIEVNVLSLQLQQNVKTVFGNSSL